MGATALRRKVVLELFYLLPVLLQLHLELLYQAAEITKRRNYTYLLFCRIKEVIKG